MKWLKISLGAMFLLTSAMFQAQAAPPPVPVFTRDEVQNLLERIDQKNSLSLLRAAYFGRRVKPPLAKEQGFELVDAALQKQTLGSQKWLLLHILRAYGAFRVPNQGSKGFESYHILFAHLDSLDSPEKQRMAHAVVKDWVFTASGSDILRFGFQGDESKRLLGEAWRLYINLPTSDVVRLYDDRWIEAIRSIAMQDDILKITQEVLAKSNSQKNQEALRLAFELSADVEAEQALVWLVQVEPLVKENPKSIGFLDYARAKVFLRQNRIDQSLDAAQNAVQLTGYGVPLLAELLHLKGDKEALKGIVNRLKDPASNEGEVIKTAEKLLTLKLKKESKELLNSYLQVKRTRSSNLEIQARLGLGLILLEENQKEEAFAVLRPAIQLQATSGVARHQLAIVNRLLK